MLPDGNDGLGLGLLGVTGDQVVDARNLRDGSRPTRWPPCAAPCRPTSSRKTRRRTPASSRTEFALRMMGDIQQYFVDNKVRNFYSVSISRLSHRRGRREPDHRSSRSRCRNGFTIVEYYLARGMKIDDFAPNLSFFFSQRHGPGIHRHRPRRAPHLGARDARALRRRRAQPDDEVPHPDVAAARCTRRKSSSTTSAPRCRRCTRCSTTATRCTPTPTTRRSPRRPKKACAARWRSR